MKIHARDYLITGIKNKLKIFKSSQITFQEKYCMEIQNVKDITGIKISENK